MLANDCSVIIPNDCSDKPNMSAQLCSRNCATQLASSACSVDCSSNSSSLSID